MRTHVRFLPLEDAGAPRYLGWYAPAHYVLEANAQLLARRFAGLRFSILTPDATADWDGTELRFGPGLDPGLVPDDAALAAQRICAAYGVRAGCFRPPSVRPGEACLRLTARANLTEVDLATAFRALGAVRDHVRITASAGRKWP